VRNVPGQAQGLVSSGLSGVADGLGAGRGTGGAERTTARIAITSGKGGVGKSTIAANLSIALARKGRKVLLVDADFGIASLDLVFGVTPEHTVLDILRAGMRPSEVVIPTPAGVDLLPAAPGRYEAANFGVVERAALRNAIDELSPSYDVVVLDTGAGIGASVIELAATADEVIVVATRDPVSIRDAYVAIKVLAMRHGLRRAHMVANQVENAKEAMGIVSRVSDLAKRFLDVEILTLGTVPRDPNVGAAAAAGQPLLVHAPNCEASFAIQRLVPQLDADRARFG